MRHRVKLNHLGRKSAHRKALLRNLACDLIRHKRITTTLAKAKALRVYVEPLITKAKTNTTHHRRVVFSYLQDKEVVTELFGDVNAKIGTRPGGYTRIIKLGARLGDAAEMALIELVDYNEIYSNAPSEKGTKKKRTRRGGSRASAEKSTTAPEANAGEAESKEEEVAETKEKAKTATAEETTKAEAEPEKEGAAPEKKDEVIAEDKTEEKPEAEKKEEPKAEKKEEAPKKKEEDSKKAEE